MFYVISKLTDLLGHGVELEHATVTAPLPAHCLPSYFGAGLEHVRTRDFVPDSVPLLEQDAEQAVHAPHVAHIPSTVE